VVSSSTPWAAVPVNASLAFLAAGSGEVSVAASLNFTPAELLPFPTYRGLWVQSAVLLDGRADTNNNNSRSSNAPAAAAEAGIGLGQIVTLVAQVSSRGHTTWLAWLRRPHYSWSTTTRGS
jgi:hypothetical protein